MASEADISVKDDDGLAADWSATSGQPPEGAAPVAAAGERILNQDEIDSLLGFASGEESDSSRNGVRAIINSSLVSYERLPMLEVVFDRVVRLMTTSLRNFTSDNVEVSLDSI
jgi:flagellar motor switch protein FliM